MILRKLKDEKVSKKEFLALFQTPLFVFLRKTTIRLEPCFVLKMDKIGKVFSKKVLFDDHLNCWLTMLFKQNLVQEK